ncbi:MAG: hypothetical protein ACRERD_08735 [Candidatus Binatia bacterium]
MEERVFERYLRSLTNAELHSLIEALDRDLLAHGWTQEQIEAGTNAYIRRGQSNG